MCTPCDVHAAVMEGKSRVHNVHYCVHTAQPLRLKVVEEVIFFQ